MASPAEWSHTLACIECGAVSAIGHRWRAYRCDDPDTGEPPELAFYCPICAAAEFGVGPVHAPVDLRDL